VAASQQHSDLNQQRLIEKHIDLNYDRYPHGRADAWLKRSGVSIWAIVAYLNIYDGDVGEVARIYDLSPEEMDAALAYYRRNRKYVDARVLLNEA
jgi:uncharacterized protein (DUF433 family)